MLRIIFKICALVLFLCIPFAASQAEGRLLLITYDSSNSMWGELADKSRKYEAGQKAVSSFLSSSFSNRKIGFRAYGHRSKNDCRDSQLMVGFSEASEAVPEINNAVAGLKPTGKTPITYSLTESLKDFDGNPGDILLISDGIETCDADPCALMTEWRNSNVEIRVHVVGVGLNNLERQALACIARESGGSYFDVNSAERFSEVLEEAGSVIELTKEQAEATETVTTPSTENERDFAFSIVGTDKMGRTYKLQGEIFKDGKPLAKIYSNFRNVVEEAGDYEILAGPVLQDGTIFKPLRKAVSITERGRTQFDLTVTSPAFVKARFEQQGVEVKGAFITAYQNGEKVFGMRHFDTILARPGQYEFRSSPNKDNKLSVGAVLKAGKETTIVFDLSTTIKAFVRYRLPDGSELKRFSELWRNGKKVYGVHPSLGAVIAPGTYELHSPDRKLPLAPVEIAASSDEEIIEVPLEAASINLIYPKSDHYFGKPDRARFKALDRKATFNLSPGRVEKIAPGRYQVIGWDQAGFFEDQEITVANGETKSVEIKPLATGNLTVKYDPKGVYKTKPNRAFVRPLENQQIGKPIIRPGVSRKLLPGRYLIEGWKQAGKIAPQEVNIIANETTTVTLTSK